LTSTDHLWEKTHGWSIELETSTTRLGEAGTCPKSPVERKSFGLRDLSGTIDPSLSSETFFISSESAEKNGKWTAARVLSGSKWTAKGAGDERDDKVRNA